MWEKYSKKKIFAEERSVSKYDYRNKPSYWKNSKGLQ